MADVVLRGVRKAYGPRTVIPPLDLAIRDGECFTLLGPSGCGKTVVLRLVAGFEQPDAGEISLGGRLVSAPARDLAVPPEGRRIGVVFQDYAVWPHRTVFENVAYPLRLQGLRGETLKRRVGLVIGQVNLAGLEDRRPSQLSGGQQQRVALARALVAKPQLLVLDEPLCNLDAKLREEMRFELKELQRETGVTILYVTHDQSEAMALSDRILVMDNGTVRQIGTPLEIYTQPADRFVFSFVGLSNFLPVRFEDGQAVVAGPAGFEPLAGVPLPEGRRRERATLACRPSEVDFVDTGGTPGVILRKAFLGEVVDYWVEVGGVTVRVQKHRRLDSLAQQAPCRLAFARACWYD